MPKRGKTVQRGMRFARQLPDSSQEFRPSYSDLQAGRKKLYVSCLSRSGRQPSKTACPTDLWSARQPPPLAKLQRSAVRLPDPRLEDEVEEEKRGSMTAKGVNNRRSQRDQAGGCSRKI